MADFSILNGYNVKDSVARESLESLDSQLKVTFLSNGTNDIGTSNIIYNDDVCIIYDVGLETTCATLRAFLKDNNISKIDAIIISHYHADHIGGANAQGLNALLGDSDFDLSEVAVYLPHNLIDYSQCTLSSTTYEDYETSVKSILSAYSITPTYPVENESITFDDVTITFHNLLATYFSEYYTTLSSGYTDMNNFSMVAIIKHFENVIAMTGDLSPKSEELNYLVFANTKLLQIQHHNADLIANVNYVEVLNPTYAVINVRASGPRTARSFTATKLIESGCVVTDTWSTQNPTFISIVGGIFATSQITPSPIDYNDMAKLVITNNNNGSVTQGIDIDEVKYQSILSVSPNTTNIPDNTFYGILFTFGQYIWHNTGAQWLWQYLIGTNFSKSYKRFSQDGGTTWNDWILYDQKSASTPTATSLIESGNCYYSIRNGICIVTFASIKITAGSYGTASDSTELYSDLPKSQGTFTSGLSPDISDNTGIRIRLTTSGQLRLHYTTVPSATYSGQLIYPIAE